MNRSPLATICWYTLIVGAITIPIVIDPRGEEGFRLPKEILFVAITSLVTVWLAVAILTDRWREMWAPRHRWLYIAILAWTIITAIVSTHGSRSVRAVILVAGAVLIMGTVETLARGRSQWILLALFIPAALNAALYVMQQFGIWDPLYDAESIRRYLAAAGRDYAPERKFWSTALAGGPTDVASMLVPATLAMGALAATATKRRLLYLLGTVAFALAVVLTEVLTASVAVMAGLLTIALRRWPRRGLVLAPPILLAVIAIAFAYPPVHKRLVTVRTLVSTGNFDSLLTGRLPAFGAAVEMMKARPLFGVGPGCFTANYFEYKLKAESTYPSLLDSTARQINFGSVHNDYLDVLAETGVIGLLLLLTALGTLGADSFAHRADRTEARKSFAIVLSLTLAVGFSVLALAQFPLSLSGALTQFVFAAGVCRAWIADAA